MRRKIISTTVKQQLNDLEELKRVEDILDKLYLNLSRNYVDDAGRDLKDKPSEILNNALPRLVSAYEMYKANLIKRIETGG